MSKKNRCSSLDPDGTAPVERVDPPVVTRKGKHPGFYIRAKIFREPAEPRGQTSGLVEAFDPIGPFATIKEAKLVLKVIAPNAMSPPWKTPEMENALRDAFVKEVRLWCATLCNKCEKDPSSCSGRFAATTDGKRIGCDGFEAEPET